MSDEELCEAMGKNAGATRLKQQHKAPLPRAERPASGRRKGESV
jgi:hypothetical protein